MCRCLTTGRKFLTKEKVSIKRREIWNRYVLLIRFKTLSLRFHPTEAELKQRIRARTSLVSQKKVHPVKWFVKKFPLIMNTNFTSSNRLRRRGSQFRTEKHGGLISLVNRYVESSPDLKYWPLPTWGVLIGQFLSKSRRKNNDDEVMMYFIIIIINLLMSNVQIIQWWHRRKKVSILIPISISVSAIPEAYLLDIGPRSKNPSIPHPYHLLGINVFFLRTLQQTHSNTDKLCL